MYGHDLQKFYKLLQNDSSVQAHLLEGDRDGFSARAVEIGGANGLHFTEEDVMAAVYAGQNSLADIEINRLSHQACLPSSGGLMALMAIHLRQKTTDQA